MLADTEDKRENVYIEIMDRKIWKTVANVRFQIIFFFQKHTSSEMFLFFTTENETIYLKPKVILKKIVCD